MTRYAHPHTYTTADFNAEEGNIQELSRNIVAEYLAGNFSKTSTIIALRAVGLFETEIATALANKA
jgi:hypothetical protein|tara:strand:- start:859 stop:1056 length:198 start_codon:yes stop_codon:yes gene_type:complete